MTIVQQINCFYNKYKKFFIKEKEEKDNSFHKAYIKINDFSFENFNIDQNETIICSIGPKTKHYSMSKEFCLNNNSNQLSWLFNYKNANRSSFVLSLYMKQIYKENIELGKVELKLCYLTPNAINRKKVILSAPNENFKTIIDISIHLSEDGSNGFEPLHNNVTTVNNF